MGQFDPFKFALQLDDALAHLSKGDAFLGGVVAFDAVCQKVVVDKAACPQKTGDVGRLLRRGVDAYFDGLQHSSYVADVLK